ncbi:MAG: D-alanyl-D-alanine carboxypeptidase [Devosia nanyangense]|uniref:D-alanyl-D-alanine carboxypeptidase n=1 Tax=Devosia nanyangense TaxID=1228055 RepID=A0A933P0F3_9HYPH|nr:D-alanyl-D-alanine carboxypeptidase [Devosia nanyangense]
MQVARFARRWLFCLALLAFPAGPASAIPMLLVDATSLEVLYAEDAGQPWHPASLTKLMTAYLAFAAIKDGRISLDTPIRVSQHAWNQAPAKSGLEVGASITLRDALYIMLVKSANDIAVAIAEAIGGDEKTFVVQMNRMAADMGLTATRYYNSNGLKNAGQVTSARDLAMLGLYIQRDYPQYMPIFQTQAVKLGTHTLETSNGLLEHFAGTTGLKTGYICQSGLNIVATVNREGRSLLAVVLGGSSVRERNELTAQLFLRGLSGALSSTGKTVVDLRNLDGAPTDMGPQICGKKAKAYVKQRMAEFPMGLKGQPSYLTDKIEGPVYVATDLGKIVTDVPLPRPRPDVTPRVAAAN